MGKTFQKPEALADTITHYCPGCTHGIAHRLVAEVIDELGIRDRTVGIAPVGCAVMCYNYFTFDFQEAAHGRAPAMATGIKRVRPDLMVFTYQGDGDLASIGMGEIIHSANRARERQRQMVEHFSGKRIAANAPIVGDDVFTQTAGIHADGDRKGGLYQTRLTPERFARRRVYALGNARV